MNKIIFDDSNKLNDFTNIGFQRHLCSIDEINLMEKLFFDYISLGEITENNLKAEPVIRNANIVGFDMKSLSIQGNPNGIDPRLSCILSKYAGQSNRANFLGLFELNNNLIANKLYSEIIWYFIDGIDKRVFETDFYDSQTFNKYIVHTSGRDITFFKSKCFFNFFPIFICIKCKIYFSNIYKYFLIFTFEINTEFVFIF